MHGETPPPYRVNNVYQINPPYNNSTISSIKTLLSGGKPITFGLHHYSYSYFGEDDVLGSDIMLWGLTHANTIVGYNDLKIDHETGETGALKVVNSWGSNWGPNQNGYYWITYQAFILSSNCVVPLNFDDVLYVNSTPNLLAIWNLNPACDRSASVELGIGPYENPLATRQPWWNGSSQVMHDYPSFMCLDITEFYSIWKNFVSDFYLKIGPATNSGTITSFKLEYYEYVYSPGNPTLISNESPDVPKNTPCHVDLYFTCIPPPVADFTWTPQNPLTNQQITFDASASFAPNGTITLYEWDWESDGVFDESHSTPIATHAWTNPGNYTTAMRVTDDHGLVNTKTKTVIVTPPQLSITIKGGLGVSASIKNIGTTDLTNINWSIALDGKMIFLGEKKSDDIPSIAVGKSVTVKDFVFGFGKTGIAVTAGSTTANATGTAFLFFVFGVK